MEPHWKVCAGCGETFDYTSGYGRHTDCYNALSRQNRTVPEKRRRRWGDIRGALSRVVYRKQGKVCTNCGARDDLTIDHIVPLAKNGTNEIGNLQVLCRSCNSRKGDR